MDDGTAGDDERYSARISDPGEVAAAVPHLLGFHPTESLVLITLGGPEGDAVGLTVRADLPPSRQAARFAASVTRHVCTARAAGVLAVVVSEAPDVGRRVPELPHRALLRELVLELSAADVLVHDMILVRRGRWWSYDCPHPCCAPGAGTPLPVGVSELAAASVATGVVVARDRDDLASRIAPPVGHAAAAMAASCREAVAAFTGRLLDEGIRATAAESWAAIQEGLRRCAPGRSVGDRLSDDEVARILCGLRDHTVRDLAMGLAIGDDSGAAEVLWTECTRRAPAPLDAPPATLLAVSAWLRGDGAMANVALDRALSGDPGYRLAQLLASALAECVPPAEIRALVASTVAALPQPATEGRGDA